MIMSNYDDETKYDSMVFKMNSNQTVVVTFTVVSFFCLL